MIKLLLNLVRIIVAACLALLFNSCRYDFEFGDGIKGNKNVTTEKRILDKDFKV